MKHVPLRSIQAVAIVAGCGLLGWYVFQMTSGIADEPAAEVEPAKQPRLLSVEFTTLQTRDLHERVELTGTILPAREVTLAARVDGNVTAFPFDLGQSVEENATIAEFEDGHLQLALSAAQAVVEGAKVQLKISQARLEYPEKILEYTRNMEKKGFTTLLNLDQTKTGLQIAQAEVELAKFRLEEARKAQQQSQLNIDRTKVSTPFRGLIAERFVGPDEFVRTGEPLVRIVEISSVIAEVRVVERDYARLATGQSAKVRVDALSGEIFTGEVIRVAPVLDVETRTAAVHVHIKNPQTRLKPGMHSRVSVTIKASPAAPALPVASLVEVNGEAAVFVLTGDPTVTEQRSVEVGLVTNDYVEILSGVSPDDRVVTLGSHVVKDGQEVQVSDEDTMTKVFSMREPK